MKDVRGQRFFFITPVVLLALTITGCDGESGEIGRGSQGHQPRGHRKMVGQLAQMAMQLGQTDPSIGRGDADRLRRVIAKLPADADATERMRLLINSGLAEIGLGREQVAIDRFSSAYDLLDSIGDQLPGQMANRTRFRLGLAYLRRGETQNCCLRQSAEACILPIRGDGIHTQKEGSSQAIRYFTQVLEQTRPGSILHLKAKWLINIAYMTLGKYPNDVPDVYLISPEVFASEEPFPRFENIAPKLGLDTFNLCGGVVVDDFDNDDYLDILTSTWDPSGQMRLFINQRNGRFADRTEDAGLIGLYGGLNMIQGDYNNDGYVDVYIMRGGWRRELGDSPNSLLRNNGDGTFTDITFDAGLGESHYPTQTAAWADYDHDGDLDLYVGNEQWYYTDSSCKSHPCHLYRNNGDGTFSDVTALADVANLRFTKGVVWGDYNGDRWPDIYVSNLGDPNRLYHNNGDGTFTDVARQLGVTGPKYSFPAWFWDFDNDGVLDIYVSAYKVRVDSVAQVAASYMGLPVSVELAKLYRGSGSGGGFEEVSQQQNLTRYNLPMGSNFGDLDNDGYLDFYLGTGYPDYEAMMPNVMYRNRGGSGFSDITTDGGFGHLQKGHAIAFADLDNDGDQDVYEQMGGALLGDKFSDAIFENPGFGHHWITIKLVGRRSNRSAIGARIRADVTEDGRSRSIYKHVNSGGSFGANPLRQSIGLGKAGQIDMLEVYWPTSDLKKTFVNVKADQMIKIVEGQQDYAVIAVRRITLGGASSENTLRPSNTVAF